MAPTAHVDSGHLQGRSDGDIAVFLGIPYAAPPVGRLRWRPPHLPAPWTGVRPATAFGFDAHQVDDPGDMLSGVRPRSEDCLTLNVWAPARRAAPAPVMVWIHGGGFTNGAASAPAYDGAALARQGIVVVTFNYRLGRFGFFAHPALSAAADGEPIGNYGFMDQIAALQWVQRNIAAFGGDPGRVTVAGESAGGWSVNMLMTSPMARGLFQGAIAQSAGGRVGTFGRSLATWSRGLDAGRAFATRAGVSGDGPEALAALRALPPEALLTVPFFTAPRDVYAGPMVDGRVLVDDPGTLFAAGAAMRVPYLVGANSREADDMPEARPMAAALLATNGPLAAALAGAYGGADEAEARLMSDIIFVEPARFTARTVSAPAYLYRFGYAPEAWRKVVPGAAHAMEVPFTFGTAKGAEDARVGVMMSRYWANFVRSANPNGPGLAAWAAHDVAGDQVLIVDLHGAAKAGPDPKRDVLDLLANSPFAPA
ncbi:MAG: carboxylesterase family protein [Alphaproteobacteria bacterium]|nr:carboxylesterase family protein [Alphaproteobacteria bacterium]MBU1515404.1 carboxylesterase family protein [Alphaproteobacteria bacterium]MBU2092961.1 carboxylesterase family protein [Alphaproteobacteria bacterium]MBU2153593.1 carboxylesterase family protein [Alphaproteobacteria bacterium]MBU2309906.1 carboxylesterase family protein [Alphaproteobacteria bacterium]